MFAHSMRALAGSGLAAALLSACSSPVLPVAGAHPADPEARPRPAVYRPVTGGYVRQRPRDPSDWRGNNERVAPQAKP
jgi:hypothetical protein